MITIDGDVVTIDGPDGRRQIDIGSREAFALLSQLWLRAGWDTKYVYSFSWLGRPIIQLPDDLIRLQEVIYRVQPDLIIEVGVAHGGSLIFCAGLCRLIGRGRVLGIEVALRPANRVAIESHPLASLVTLVDGSSTDPAVIEQVMGEVQKGERVLVTLDGCHDKEHVLAELEAYAPLVSPDSYIIAMDGIMEDVVGAPRTHPDWTWNNPKQAALAFAETHPEFVIEDPPLPFNEGETDTRVTYWPGGYLKRLS